MLRYFLKILKTLRKIFNFKAEFTFFIRNTKNNHSSASDWWENTFSLKENARTLSKQDELYQLENIQAKGAKLRANIR